MSYVTQSSDSELLKQFATHLGDCLYEDYPITVQRQRATRAEWTAHYKRAVKSAAERMQLTVPEKEWKRFDGVVRDHAGAIVALVEWEYAWMVKARRVNKQPVIGPKVNEFEKLKTRCNSPDQPRFACYIGYVKVADVECALKQVDCFWAGSTAPLLLVLIQCERRVISPQHRLHKDDNRKKRVFKDMIMYQIVGDGSPELVWGPKPAIPWKRFGSRP